MGCLSSCNVRGAVFGMQFVMSFMGLTFTMLMISTGRDADIYMPVMTSIVGYWLPSPVRSLVSDRGTNSHLLVFATQAAMSMMTLVFSGYMLYFNAETTVFLPIVTSILAYWLPNPNYLEQKPAAVDTSDLDVALLRNEV